MPSDTLLKRRKLIALRKSTEPAKPRLSPVELARLAYVNSTATKMMRHLPVQWPTECACVIVEYLVPFKLVVNYASHELSQFSQMGRQRPYTIPGWMSLNMSFEKSCSIRGQNMKYFVLKDHKGVLVHPGTIWNDLYLGEDKVQLTVCLRK
jgi:hypothetical protein